MKSDSDKQCMGKIMTVGKLRQKLAHMPADAAVLTLAHDMDGNETLMEVLTSDHNHRRLRKTLKKELLVLDAFNFSVQDEKSGARAMPDLLARMAVFWLDTTKREKDILIRYAQLDRNRIKYGHLSEIFSGSGDVNARWHEFASTVHDAYPSGADEEDLFIEQEGWPLRMDFTRYTQLRLFLIGRKLLGVGDDD